MMRGNDHPTGEHVVDQPDWVLAGLAALGAAVAGYLTWVAWQHHALPLGCGDDGGCSEVLKSKYAGVWGVPVSLFAVPLYLAVVAAAWRPRRPGASTLMSFAAFAIFAAAAWFLWLQAGVLRAFCPWCVAEHLLGIVVVGLVMRHLSSRSGGATDPGVRVGALLGIVSVLGLALLQSLQPARDTTIRRPQQTSVNDVDGASQVVLLEGKLPIDARHEPLLGRPTAEHHLYLMFDYCCPHCRRTHEYLLEALAQYPEQLALVSLPMPRDADCNPAIEATEERFEHACELARLALAVWKTEPAAFPEFDRWLFEPTRPPTAEAARAKALELVSVDQLEQGLADPEVTNKIQRNVDAFNASQVNYLPVIMAAQMDTIVGRPESREALLGVLESELLKQGQQGH